MQHKTIPGHFTKVAGSSCIGISEEEARRLLGGHHRDIDQAVEGLKANPFGLFKAEDCAIRYEVHRAPVETVPDGGPSLRGPFDDREVQVQFMLDLVADHDPVNYERLFARVEQLLEAEDGASPSAVDGLIALLMEQLDSLRTDLLFGLQRAHPEDTHLTLGFWPLEV